MFRRGRGDAPPNNWPSCFGGPAWTRDPRSGEWYLHLFAPEQPDLDWHNEAVRADFEGILRFWLGLGVDGFRIDVAHALFKDRSLRDEQEPFPVSEFTSDWRAGIDQPELHPLYRRWRDLLSEYPGDRVLIGEVVFSDPARAAAYLRPDELHMAFNFTFLFAPWSADRMRAIIARSLAAVSSVGAPSTWGLENHDVARLPSRYGGGDAGHRAARAAALLLLALPGPVFLYAGQELGLDEAELPDEVRQDPIFFRSGGARKGRDGCRVPLPWSASGPGYGFSGSAPWLPIPDGWNASCVAAQEKDAGSTLSLFRSALALRARTVDLRGRSFRWRVSAPGTLVFQCGADVVCAVNLDGAPLALPAGEVLISSQPLEHGRLPLRTAAWVRS